MAYSYLVTTQKPTAVQHAVVCNFTSALERNLILVKSNRIEIHTLTPEGLLPILDTPLHGRITSIDFYRPVNCSQDVLFLLLESKQFCILGFDPATKAIINRARGNVRDKAGRDVETGARGFIDPEGRVIGMHLYEGLLKVVPIENTSLREAYNVRLEELRVLDITFLHGCAKPTLCILYEDARRGRHLKTYTLDSREKELLDGPLHQNNVEQGAHILIPIPGPANGVVVVGQCSISYVGDGGYATSVGIQRKQIVAYGAIDSDGSRYLLSDANGVMYVLILQREGQHVAGLVMEQLGVTSIPECLCYLDNGVVFVGSGYGDSQLVKLLSTPDANGEHVEILERYMNIGPVLDMCVVQSERQGQCQLVTCSGAYKDGSIRVVRSGIGIQEQASLDVPGIKSVWSLYGAENKGFDKYLVQSFAWDTRVLALENDELAEVMIPGLSNTQSLYCGNMIGDMMIQITATSARLIDLVSLQLLSEFTAPSKIIVASANKTQVVLALSGGDLFYLEADPNTKSLLYTATTKLDQDVACLSLRPVFVDNHNENIESASTALESEPMDVASNVAESDIHETLLPGATAFILAVGLWTENSVRLFALPSLEEITRVSLGVDTQVRDVMLVSFANQNRCIVSVEEDITSDAQDVRFRHCHLLVGLGDGMLLTYVLDLSEQTLPKLQDRREIIVGSRPISLSCFVNDGSLCVFAACDRPTVIYARTSSSKSSVEKLLFSVVNTSEVTNMAPFHTPLFPSCLSLSSDTGLTIGTVDAIQKIHIQSYPLEESPRRLCHHLASASIAVCSERTVHAPSGDYTNERVLLLDDATITPKDVYEMEALEQILSCSSMYLSGLDTEVIIVGTALVLPEEHQPSKGRILVLEVTRENKLRLLCERSVPGAVYAVASINGRLAAACDSSVDVFRWQRQEGSAIAELVKECTHHGNILALLLKAQDDTLLVGDVFRSVSILKYSNESRELQELCRDFNSHYMRAIEIWGEGFYVCSEDKGNIFIGRHNATAESEEERGKLEIISAYHAGEYLNAMRPGNLSNQLGDHGKSNDGAATTPQSILMGSVSGALMTLMMLTEEEFKFFSALEKAILHVVKGVGGLPHDEWRAFASERRHTFTRRTIDGDLIELFLELSSRGMQQAVSHLNDELNVKPQSLEIRRGQLRPETKMEDAQHVNFSVEDVILRVDEMVRRHQ